jgi:hypothetical protein
VGLADLGGAKPDLPLRLPFISTMGGVMTDEVGAVTGELALRISATSDGGIGAMLSDAGASDLYTVSGSPVRAASLSEHPDEVQHRAAHERILETLTTPGRVEGGNEMPVGLLED